MIVTNHFVYIHTSRSAGTFLNKLIMEQVPGARLIQYHGHLRDLPAEYVNLPVIGFVRNPWDWYISMFFDYRRKQQYVFQILSQGGSLGFHETVARFLNLGDGSDLSCQLLARLQSLAPSDINAQTPRRVANPGLKSEHFRDYPPGMGYYSWLFRLMYKTERSHRVHIGRFEQVREEALRLFDETGTPITDEMRVYLKDSEPRNDSQRPVYYAEGYTPALRQLVAEKDRDLIAEFAYEFSGAEKYPKTDFFGHLGVADVNALVERVRKIPEEKWVSENEGKPNKNVNRLNDTSHVVFRFVKSFGDAFDYDEYPLWDEWKDVLLPIMDLAAKKLGYSTYQFPRVMLARLPAGAEISPHKDTMASHYVHKIHVPLITNPKTIFHVGTKSKHLQVGEIVEVNNKRSHAVFNKGNNDRVHLIFECYNEADYKKFA